MWVYTLVEINRRAQCYLVHTRADDHNCASDEIRHRAEPSRNPTIYQIVAAFKPRCYELIQPAIKDK